MLPKMSPRPPKIPQVTQMPTVRKATSLITDSAATAVMRPVCCLVKSRFRAPKRIPKRASVTATKRVGSNTSSTEPSCMIRLNVADTARSWSAM